VKRISALVGALVALAAVAGAPVPKRPSNVVLILVDTLRRDHLPFYGYARDTAPFLGSLAAKGVVFERAHSVSGWTAPATASLFTSLYPFEHGVVRGLALAKRQERLKGVAIRLPRVPTAAETIPEALRRRGYATFAITENPNLTHALGFDQGFDRFDAFPSRLDAEPITERLLERAPELRRRAPYFLYLHYMDVHAPYRERPPLFDPSLEGDARRVSAYDSGIHTVDAHIGRAFEALGWDRDTLVVVLADHGEELGERGRFGHGATLFAELLDIPMLVYGPGTVPRRVPDRVSLVDVLPTLRAFAGLPPASTDAGVSLLPLLRDPGARLEPRPLFAHLWRRQGRDGREQALRVTLMDDWKRIGGDASGTLLFDLRSDPGETRNRTHQEPERERELQRLYQQREARASSYAGESVEVGLDDDAIEGLAALGYVN
jgi:arylsulfatase A-like enzyme